MSRVFSNLAVSGADELIYGSAPVPVACGLGLTIGAGQVYPEVNFTLPAITIDASQWSAIIRHYQEMGANILKRAAALRAAGKAAVDILREGLASGQLNLITKERDWLDKIDRELETLPPTAEDLRAAVDESIGGLYDPVSYGWA